MITLKNSLAEIAGGRNYVYGDEAMQMKGWSHKKSIDIKITMSLFYEKRKRITERWSRLCRRLAGTQSLLTEFIFD